MTLILGTRGSPLALAQARQVASRIEVTHEWPANEVTIEVVKTTGDRIQDRPLADIGGKALWTKELDQALLAKTTDVSVHSMKDVESDRPDAFCIAAMLKRADTRDRLIGAKSIEELKQGAVVGTSSPRRTAQLLRLRPDLKIIAIRGNVETRLKKLAAGECDATLLAAAGLDRLNYGEIGSPLDLLPAPAQGAIGIEVRRDDQQMRRIVAAVSHPATFAAVLVEREFTRALGGTCHSPIAALATVERDGSIAFRAELYSEDGADCIADDAVFAADDLVAPADFARAMLARSPVAIARLFGGG